TFVSVVQRVGTSSYRRRRTAAWRLALHRNRMRLLQADGARSTRFRSHLDSVLGPQRKAGHRGNRMIRHRAELKTLRDGGQQQRRFHHCERVADALPGAAAEWEVWKARPLLES